MSDLDIKPIEIEELKKRDLTYSEISLKRDGTLMYFRDGHLVSARGIVRDDRYPHILKLLKDNDFPNCFGEMYVEGGNVLDINSKDNWKGAKFMPIDMEHSEIYSVRQLALIEKIRETNSDFITQKIIFTDINLAWDLVVKEKLEGLVIKDKRELFKCKLLQEAKIEIIGHEPSKEKGTFLLVNNNRISGTSRDFVQKFKDIKAQGKIPIAEIEYCFITKDNHYFQPRLRRIETKENL